MKLDILKGTTSRIVEVFIQDSSSTVGAGLTGLAWNTASLTAYYTLNGAAGGATVHTLATMTIGTWASGGFVEKDATNMPGWYQLGVFNAALTGADSVGIMLKGAANMAPLVMEIQLVDYDPYAATAWANFIKQYDTTGLTGDNFPSTQAQVGNIGSAGGGGRNFAADHDNTTRDTIDNAGAVDKGSGLVGIPVTGHAFSAGNEITIAGSTNYNDAYEIISQTTNEVVITDTFVSETFGGSETIVSSIKGIIFVGTLASGTFASIEAEDNVYQQITDDTDAFDIVYRIPAGGSRLATDLFIRGYLNSANDSANIQAYDFVGSAWDTVKIWGGQGAATNITQDAKLLDKHTGLGNELGDVLIRIVTTGQSTPILNIDQLLVEAIEDTSSVGYVLESGVTYDTSLGASGVIPGVNGTADNPSDNEADATSISVLKNLESIRVGPGSIFTAAQDYAYTFSGPGAAMAFGGRDLGGSRFFDLTCSGISTGASRMVFRSCAFFAATTVELGAWVDCVIAATITLSGANTYRWRNTDFNGSAILDCGAVGAQTLFLDHYSGVLEIQNLAAGDDLHVHGTGNVTLNANCSGGTFEHSSDVAITDNSGNVTITVDLAATDVNAISGDTGAADNLEADYDGTGYDKSNSTIGTTTTNTDMRGTDSAALASTIGTPADTDIATDIANVQSTATAIEADTQNIQSRLPAALSSGNMKSDMLAVSTSTEAADKLEAHALETLPVTFTTSGGGTTTAILNQVDGSGASATDDVYIGRILLFNSGTLDHQVAEITDYDGTSKAATISAITTAPTSSHTARMI